MAEKPKFVPVVAVLNMKGGVGKTTLSANVFRVLFETQKKKTLLLDVDPQFNLTQTVFKSADYEKYRVAKKTIAQVFESSNSVKLFEISDNHTPPPPVEELKHTFWKFTGSSPLISLDVVPGDFSLVKYSLMRDHDQLDRIAKRFKRFVNNSKTSYDLVVIDCNPSSPFLTICALSVCTHILVPVRPDKYSVLGLDMLWEYVHDILPISPKPAFVISLNGVPRQSNSGVVEVISELRAHQVYGPLTLANVVHESGVLRARTDFTGFATDRRVSRSKLLKAEMTSLASELSSKIGLKV